MASYHSLVFILLFLCYFDNKVTADCGDWNAYKDEKCLKIFDAPGLVTYEDAENYCKVEQDAHLITIGVEEEQNFIQSYLTSHKIADNVWIGLKYVNNVYQWVDETPLHYTKWASGSPRNDSDHCVQIQADETEFGYWSDVLCTKKNLIICEKIQLWSPIELQQSVVNLIKNQVPIGFIYVQLPKEKSPSEIWSWMEWKDVSTDYAGVFFRVLGGDSDSFGVVQKDNSPRFTHVRRDMNYLPAYKDVDIVPGQESLPWDAELSERSDRGVYFKMSGGEVRPINMAARVWKRVL